MKKLVAIVVTTTLALGIILSGDAHAGNEGWAAAGGFLGGLVVGSVLSSRPYYYYSRPVYAYPVYSSYGCRTYYYYPVSYTTCTTYTTYYPYYYYECWY